MTFDCLIDKARPHSQPAVTELYCTINIRDLLRAPEPLKKKINFVAPVSEWNYFLAQDVCDIDLCFHPDEHSPCFQFWIQANPLLLFTFSFCSSSLCSPCILSLRAFCTHCSGPNHIALPKSLSPWKMATNNHKYGCLEMLCSSGHHQHPDQNGALPQLDITLEMLTIHWSSFSQCESLLKRLPLSCSLHDQAGICFLISRLAVVFCSFRKVQ